MPEELKKKTALRLLSTLTVSKTKLFENALQVPQRRICVLVWKNIWKTKLFENNDVTKNYPIWTSLEDLGTRWHYAGRIKKKNSFALAVHTNRFENEAFRKRSSSSTTPDLRFSVEKHLENEAFRKQWRHDYRLTSLTEFYSPTNPKWPVIVWTGPLDWAKCPIRWIRPTK